MTPAIEIQWMSQGTQVPDDVAPLGTWIKAVAERHGRILGPVNYIFCDDKRILEVNRQFLGHDYYTDIITFDNTHGRRIQGDIFISLNTVRSNAENLGQDATRELQRVIIHGILHLCGINDKGPGEREVMEAHEDEALRMLDSMLSSGDR